MNLDFESIKSKIEKIDFSEVSTLVGGLILLLIPLVFLYTRTKSSNEKLSIQALQENKLTTRKGFFYVQNQELKSSKGTISSNFYQYSYVNKEWDTAISKITEAKNTFSEQIKTLPDEIRLFHEAEQNNQIRWTNALINTQRYKEALTILLEMATTDESNPFLNFMISANLCTVYEKLGYEKELQKEFNKLVLLISKLPKIGFEAEVFKGLSEWLKLEPILSKLKHDPQTKEIVKNILLKHGSNNAIDPQNILSEQMLLPQNLLFYQAHDKQ